MLASYRAGAGFDGMFEYSPPNSDITAIARGLPDACLVADPDAELGQLDPDDSSANPIWTLDQKSCVATFATDRFDPEHLRLNAMVPQSGWLVLRLLAFPAWRAELNGQALASDRANALHTRPDGMIAVRVERGPIHLDISWKTTSDVILGRWVSAIALVLAVLPAWFERRLVRD